jgi:amidase
MAEKANTLHPEGLATWQEKAAWAQNVRDESVAKVEPKLEALPTDLPLSSQDLPRIVLTDREIEITEKYTVKELLRTLRERKISVEEVTRAFLRRAAVAQLAVRFIIPQDTI